MTAMLEGMTSGMPPAQGRLLDGRYRLGTVLGVGGVAEVYRAIDERLHRGVAVKLFRGDVGDELQRHEEEMRTLARLNHPSLVTVFDAGTDPETDQPYLVMALVEGSTLSEQLRAEGSLSPEQTAEIGAAVAEALAYVHAQGLIHRDVKPANVLISNAGRVFLADFGIARLVNAAHITQAGDVLGTPAFFAPEQVAGEAVGPPADIYALGLVLLECLTGKREYDGSTLEVAMARLSRPPVIPDDLPPAWRGVLSGMTEREPDARLTAEQVAERLTEIASGVETEAAEPLPGVAETTTVMPAVTSVMPAADTAVVAAPPPEPMLTDVAPPPRRRGARVALVLLTLLILAAAGIAAGVVLHDRNSSSAIGHCAAKPTLPSKLESDMQKIEKLACR
jgi:serine/threonine protein kinase